MKSVLFTLITVIFAISITNVLTNDVFDNIKQILAFGQSSYDVMKTFTENNFESKNPNKSVSPSFSFPPMGFLRLLGFGTKRLGAVVINAAIFITKLISTSFEKSPSYHQERNNMKSNGKEPFEWILNYSGFSTLFDYAKTVPLVPNILNYVKEQSLDEESGCLQLLFCKSSEFLGKLQNNVVTNDKVKRGIDAINAYFLNRSIVLKNGIRCEMQNSYCNIYF